MRVMSPLATISLIAFVVLVMQSGTSMAEGPNPATEPSVGVIDEWGDGGSQIVGSHTQKAQSSSETHSGSGGKSLDPLPQIDLADNVRQCHQVSRVSVTGPDKCDPPIAKAKPSAKQPTATQLRTVAAQLKLPNPTPRFGPDPSVNEWNMLAVGFPIWLWTDRPTTVSTTAHHDGLDFTLTATWTSTTFTMGDGHTKTCTATTIRSKTVKPATKPSPTCGYVYQTKSKTGHPYTVTANTHWRIDWTTNGYQGTFTHTYTGNRTLEIGELQSLING